MNYTSIILSGLPASGKTTLAKRLSEHWGWPIHSLGQIWRDQWKEKYPQAEISFEGYWRQTSLEDNISINQKAKEIFRKGAVIGESRYSIYCDDIPSLSLFITAPLETRASRSADKYLDTSFFERKKILAGREKDEVEKFPDHEKEEVSVLLRERGFGSADAQQLTALISANKPFWVDFMMRYELNLHDEGRDSELASAFLTFASFIIAGSLPLIPFLIFEPGVHSFAWSIASTATALFLVGASRARITKKGFAISGLEMLIVGGIAAGVAYMVGYFISNIV